ncbi:MAG: sigma-54-dependent Fis family transcriptional regulator [Pirellulaceae bacterium]|nr:sigma-54-dependent Fis family transcriptional regulator [Pirellulaceae bacterium]
MPIESGVGTRNLGSQSTRFKGEVILVRILIVVDDRELERRFDRICEPLETAVATAPHNGLLWDRVTAFPTDLVVIGRSSLTDPIDATVETIRALPDRPEVIVVGEDEQVGERASLLIAGCTAVLNTSLDDDTLRKAFDAFVSRQRKSGIERLQREIDAPQAQLSDFDSVSTTMQSFLRIVKRVVQPDSSLLIQGETGVGKERLARAIHAASPRAGSPFIPVILSAFPESLVEGELFGYVAGAFTGAVGTRRGCFELAHGGTIFLDEIGELPPHIQVKLLRVLQDRTIQRLGSEESIRVNVRVMAATNRNLLDEVKSDRFRQDLYYRLSVVTLEIPPLRHHSEDISKLANRYLDEFRVRLNSKVTAFTEEAMQAMERYPWPGNIREVINVVERAVLLCEGEKITVDDLPRTIVPAPRNSGSLESTSSLDALFEGDWHSRPWKDVRNAIISSCEQAYFVRQLGLTNGNVEETARLSKINPRSLYDLMKRHGMKKESFRNGGK